MSLLFPLMTPKRCHKRQPPGIHEPNALAEGAEIHVRRHRPWASGSPILPGESWPKMSRLLAGSRNPQFGVQILGT